MRNRLFFLLCLYSLSTSLSAQTSGGQIRRSNQNVNRKSLGNQKNTRHYYPQRDEVFLSDAVLPIKSQLDLSKVDFVLLPPPNFNGHLLKRNSARSQIKLKEISCKYVGSRDYESWLQFSKSNLNKEFYKLPNDKYGLQCRIQTSGFHALLFGQNNNHMKVIVTDKDEKYLYVAYDFENYRMSPKTKDNYYGVNEQSVWDVYIEGNIMYVSHFGGGNSVDFGYQTGYISAINMLRNEVIWTTQPMTNNCSKIAVVGNSIIAGYGFSEESDFLYVLDKYSGQRVQKIPIKSAADYVIVKGQNVYVGTYSYDYVFAIQEF